MWVLILLCGMRTLSWYAELALRTRVSMSAIGSVIVMKSLQPFSLRSKRRNVNGCPSWFELCSWVVGLLRALGDAGQLAGVRHHADADAAEPERAEDRARAT